VERNRRYKPFQILAERTIGYSVEGVAPVGLEGSFDRILAGTSGKRLMQKVSGGVWIPINDENEIEPENGKDIIATLDVNIQDVAEDALHKALVKHNAQYGTAVLMEVETGEIKAIANLTKMPDGSYREQYNYAIGLSAEPGSTFKLASVIALLEDGYVELTDSFDTEHGQKKYFDRIMKDAEEGGHGKVSFQQAFELSSNVAISKAVYANYAKQPSKFIERLEALKLDQALGLQLSGEGTPHIKHPKDKDWYGTTLPWTSIGYEVHITPLQMLTLYNAVANKGRMVKPKLVREIQQTGRVLKQFPTEEICKSICSEATLKAVKLMMEGVVERGTAKNLKNPYYTIAGKTGTAQIADAKHGYNKVYQSTFCGYFPADKPKYSCIVLVNSPSNGIYYGALVAGPVFREIADKVYSGNTEMQPAILVQETEKGAAVPAVKAGFRDDLQRVLNRLAVSSQLAGQEDAEWVSGAPKNNAVQLNSRTYDSRFVPNVSGMSLKDALYLLENAGLRVLSRGYGRVRNQSLQPGQTIIKGSTIYIELG
jgi:cell division protein FtsI (penicillin-binding protein 3)